MGIKGKVIPPNVIDTIITDGKPTQDFAGFLNNVSRTITIRGSASPEGVVEAPIGTQYMDLDAIATPGTFMYIKTTETGKTGWKLQ